jgi:hypothetical protein
MPGQYLYVGTAPIFTLLRLDRASPEPRALSANNREGRALAVVNERNGLNATVELQTADMSKGDCVS